MDRAVVAVAREVVRDIEAVADIVDAVTARVDVAVAPLVSGGTVDRVPRRRRRCLDDVLSVPSLHMKLGFAKFSLSGSLLHLGV
jgi:hypothetical protein